MKIEIKLILEYDSWNMTEKEKRKVYEVVRDYMRAHSNDEAPIIDDELFTDLYFFSTIDKPDKWSYDVSADENAMFKPE